jgi:two-component sensor histidine kinase
LAAPGYAEQINSLLISAYAGERSACELTRSMPDLEGDRLSHYSVIFEPERDNEGNISGVVIVVFDITERKKTEEHVQMLLREVNHRSKNMLSVVSAIARQTKAPSREEYVERFSERIHALAASHDLLSSRQWQAIAMTELVSAQLAHFEALMGTRVTIEGPAVSLSATGAQFLGMVVHELATNAAKHGALSNQSGRVSLCWDIERMPEGDRFKVAWIESDGPSVVPPSQRGYGSTVIQSLAELSLDGRVVLDFAPTGFSWRLECPASKVIDTPAISTFADCVERRSAP